ncbi:MAG: hypothetical protein PHE17_15550 [Thiothrix sp.]|uniref:helix-turn-helix transcriptional regulator n=1 Tax=Thiothrix sp. TaxID=1032 RepID=UPI0026220E43|nr:hypothetical protein [Thiothrix sp.]MDD5394430.1 hypothetical protein [Thiothrix sp.]
MAKAKKMQVLNIEDYKRKVRNTKPKQEIGEHWLGINEMLVKLSTSRSTFNRKRDEGLVPKPTYFGLSPKWLLSEIDAWMTSEEGKL